MKRKVIALAAALALTPPTVAQAAGPHAPSAPGGTPAAKARPNATLLTRSVLPADTFVPGSEPSGHFVKGIDGAPAPFPGQPVQGFSATHRLGDGSYLVMSDNGFGTKANSGDALLSVHRIRPGKPSADKPGQPGKTEYLNTMFRLSDPSGFVPWRIWRDGGCAATADLPQGYTCQRPDRLLTGRDFDIESMQVAPDGTFWFGEEFGPYLLHTDAQGRLLAPPVPTPGVKSPSNPTLAMGEKPNLPDSKGFEGMAASPDGRTLYPLLEGATQEDKDAGRAGDLRFYQVTAGRSGARFTGTYWRYRMEAPTHAIGDFIAVNDHQFLVVERDNGQGATAAFRRIYLVDIRAARSGGYAAKRLVADLMNVADPKNVGGMGARFTFPFVTIEDLAVVDANTIAVMNDDNYPSTGGRGEKVVDDNEYIELRLPRPLKVDERVLGSFVPYGKARRPGTRLSVIGDVPYGSAQVAAFPRIIDDINAARTRMSVHVGDIKNGSTRCDDAYYAGVKAQFDRLRTPLVYTPGDNEWTDCHRPNNGAYDPLERLAALRAVFFATPDMTNGRRVHIASQAGHGFPENVSWRADGLSFAAIHVVGSDDALEPRTGQTEATPEQVAAQKARMGNARALVEQTFANARARKDRAVVLFTQADMFDPTYAPKAGSNRAFVPLVEDLVKESSTFDGKVYLINGDSHVFNVDSPLAAGSPWLAFYGVAGAANNLTRVTVDGSSDATNWLEVTVERAKGRDPLTWRQVPFTK